MSSKPAARVAFLFLGETLLVPHLYPIAEALGRMRPDMDLDLWVANEPCEKLLLEQLTMLALPNVRVRRAPGFGGSLHWPGAKLVLLARMLPNILRATAVVCAEQTSLWLPYLLPLRMPFIKTSHGVGSMSARDTRRRTAAWRMLVPSELERSTYLVRGDDPERIIATGYVKTSFERASSAGPHFAEQRPTVLYTPHWQKPRSSWWLWGRDLVARLAEQTRYNVILQPHQRLIERDPGVREALMSVAHLPHVHVDLDSFSMIDGSYLKRADIYLGDTSSQVVEFLATPRPCVFLNAQRLDWRATDDHGFWECGEVVDQIDAVLPALDRAAALHGQFVDIQTRFAAEALGPTDGTAPGRCADIVLEALER